MEKTIVGLASLFLLLLGLGTAFAQPASLRPDQFVAIGWNWTGQNAEPLCPLPDAAIIQINVSACGNSGTFIASIGGNTNTLTVTGNNVTLAVGGVISGPGIIYNTIITGLGTGTGNAGTYTLNNTYTQAVSSETMNVTYGVGYHAVTLTASGHKIAFPAGSVVPGSGFELYINEGSGPFTVNIAQGLFFPPSSLSGSQLVLSGTANGKNEFFCRATSPVEYHCGAVQAGLVSASVINRVNGAVGSLVSSGTAATVTVAPTGANTYICWASTSGGSANPPTGVSDGTNALTKLSENVGGDGTDHSVWGKVGISGSPTTMTATWAGTQNNIQVSCDYFSGVVSFGAVVNPPNFQSHPATSANAITSGTVTVVNNNVLWGGTIATGATPPGGSTTVAIGTGFTAALHDATANHWGFTSEYASVSGGTPTAATFTDATNAGSMYYLTVAVVLQ